MNWFSSFLTSNIGRKLIMALTGLFLVSFLVVHLSGNLLLLRPDSGEAFNIYSHFMTTNPVIRVLEIGLLLGFVLHIYTSVVLTQHNKKARPTGYSAGNNSPGVAWYSKNMGITGSIILVFLIIHLKQFYWEFHNGAVRTVYYTSMSNESLEKATKQMVVVDKANVAALAPEIEVLKDMAIISNNAFENIFYVIGYVLAFGLLAMHLRHGCILFWHYFRGKMNKILPCTQGQAATSI